MKMIIIKNRENIIIGMIFHETLAPRSTVTDIVNWCENYIRERKMLKKEKGI